MAEYSLNFFSRLEDAFNILAKEADINNKSFNTFFYGKIEEKIITLYKY